MDWTEDHVISRYTREQAIEDGVLVDVTRQAKETGILLPTVITEHVHQVLEDIPAGSGQDYRGRLHDVLWMTYLKLKQIVTKRIRQEHVPTEVHVIIDAATRKLWITIDGDGLTIMFPEDY